MVLRILAILFFVAAAVTGFVWGWQHSIGGALYRATPGMLNGLQAFIQRYTIPDIWDIIFVPVLELPAWAGLVLIAMAFVVAAALRPGKG